MQNANSLALKHVYWVIFTQTRVTPPQVIDKGLAIISK